MKSQTEILRKRFKTWRYDKRLAFRELEKVTGMSNANLSKFEAGVNKNISYENGCLLWTLIECDLK